MEKASWCADVIRELGEMFDKFKKDTGDAIRISDIEDEDGAKAQDNEETEEEGCCCGINHPSEEEDPKEVEYEQTTIMILWTIRESSLPSRADTAALVFSPCSGQHHGDRLLSQIEPGQWSPSLLPAQADALLPAFSPSSGQRRCPRILSYRRSAPSLAFETRRLTAGGGDGEGAVPARARRGRGRIGRRWEQEEALRAERTPAGGGADAGGSRRRRHELGGRWGLPSARQGTGPSGAAGRAQRTR
ncbi:hypothetical protein U9M48_036526, partial [Paspalum notatum var. saurae]